MSQNENELTINPDDVDLTKPAGSGTDLQAGGSQAKPHDDTSTDDTTTSTDDTTTDTGEETPAEKAARERAKEQARIAAERKRIAAEKARLEAEVAANDKLRLTDGRLQVKFGGAWFFFDDKNIDVVAQAKRTDAYTNFGEDDFTVLDDWGTYKTDSDTVNNDYVDWNLQRTPADTTEYDSNMSDLTTAVEADPNLRIHNGQLQIKVDQWNFVPVSRGSIAAAQKLGNVDTSIIDQWEDLKEKPEDTWKINLGSGWADLTKENVDVFNSENPDYNISWHDTQLGKWRTMTEIRQAEWEANQVIPDFTVSTDTSNDKPVVYYDGKWHYVSQEHVDTWLTGDKSDSDLTAFRDAHAGWLTTQDEQARQDYEVDLQGRLTTAKDSGLLKWENEKVFFFADDAWRAIEDFDLFAGEGKWDHFTENELNYFHATEWNAWIQTDDGKKI